VSRPVVIGVENVADIIAGLPEDAVIVRTGPGIHTLSWREHALTVRDTGIIAGGKRWFYGSGSKLILVGLAHLGADIRLVSDLTTAQRDQLRAAGIRAIRRVSDGAIVGLMPPVVFAGEQPISVGLDGQLEDGEQYAVDAAL
jgi:hypothetical protein